MLITKDISTNERVVKSLEQIKKIVAKNVPVDDEFLRGRLGLILFYFYFGSVQENNQYIQKAENLLEQIFDSLNSNTSKLIGYSLSSGSIGFCHLLTHLVQEEFIDLELDEALDFLEEYIYKKALEDLEERRVDYLYQSFGAIQYFNERLPNTRIKMYLEKLIDKVFEVAIIDEAGFRFMNSFEEGRHRDVDFGLAHGLVGQLIILSNSYQLGVKQKKIATLIDEGIKYILNYRSSPGHKDRLSFFPISINDFTKPRFSDMLAWCYGDLCQLYMIFKVNDILTDKIEDSFIKEMIDKLSERRIPEENSIKDAHFCHGASGVAYMFKTLSRYSDDVKLKESYTYWMEQTLDFLNQDFEHKNYKGGEGFLLEGFSGIGLVLLDYISDEDLKWGKLLLL